MKSIKVGLCYENGIDIAGLRILLTRLFALSGSIPVFVKELPVGTGIMHQVINNTKIMIGAGCEVGVFCTDLDKSKEEGVDRKDQILKLVGKADPGFVDLSVIAIPNPCFEAWLLVDEDLVKHVFNLKGDKPLPGKGQHPKRQFQLIHSLDTHELAEFESTELLARDINFTLALKDKAFHDFSDSVKSAIANT